MGDTIPDELKFNYDEEMKHWEEHIVQGLGIPKDVWEKYTKLTEEKLALAASAGEDALEEINKVCGCKNWEYPGQLVRDVRLLKEKADALASKLEDLIGAIDDPQGDWHGPYEEMEPSRKALEQYRRFFPKKAP